MSVEHTPKVPWIVQLPAGAGSEHSASLTRWYFGTRPPSTPLDVPPPDVPPEDPVPELLVPLEVLELPELLDPPEDDPVPPLDEFAPPPLPPPELDEPPASPFAPEVWND